MSIIKWVGRQFGLTDERAVRHFFGNPSHAGKTVNEKTAMQLSTVWGCVKLISEAMGTLPLGVYRRTDGGGRESANDHPVAELIRSDPNADETAVEYWEGTGLQLCLRGNSFSEKKHVGKRLVALQPLLDFVKIERLDNGAPIYVFSDRGKYERLPADKVFHVKGFGALGGLGLAPLSHAKNCLGNALASEEVVGKLFSNGLFNGGVLTMPSILKQEQREQVQKNIIAPLIGTAGSGGTMLLEGGMKYEKIKLNPAEAEFLESRRFSVEEICRWFGVPPILVQHAAQGQTMWGSGIEQIMMGWYTLGLRPFLKRTEAAINKRLFTREERRIYYAEFNIAGLLRGDSAARAEYYTKMVQNGIFTRNEVRDLENRNHKPGGDDLTVQSQMISIDQLQKVNKG